MGSGLLSICKFSPSQRPILLYHPVGFKRNWSKFCDDLSAILADLCNDWLVVFGFNTTLTHYQTTNFRLFQTERVCRRQIQICRKWHKVIQAGRKHCGKRRNCSSRAISPFPTVFSKGLLQKVSLCGNGLTARVISWRSVTSTFPGFLTPVLTQFFFPPTTFLTCFCRR